MKLYIIRHGMVVWDQTDGKQRQQDPSLEWIRQKGGFTLMPQGVLQAVMTGKKLSTVDFSAILVSPLIRAVMTASEIARQQKTAKYLEIWPELQESRGAGAHKFSKEEMEYFWPLIKYPESMEDTCWTGKHDDPLMAEFEYKRAERVVGKLKERFSDDENVLLVTHGRFIQESLVPFLLGMDVKEAGKFFFYATNCGISKFDLQKDKTSVACINETAHLEETFINTIFC